MKIKLTQIAAAAEVVEAARALRDYDSDPQNIHYPPDAMWAALRRAFYAFAAAASEDPGEIVEGCARAICKADNGSDVNGWDRTSARAALAAVPGIEV